MPTVHLSLPEALHRELKQYANEMGMSITDLIRMMIREGLQRLREERAAAQRQARREPETTEALLQVLQKLEELERRMEEYQAFVEGELYRINSSLHSLKKRVSKLEDTVEEQLIPVEAELVRP